MELWRTNRLKRINLLEGSVRSGKTWISLVLWAFWVKTMPQAPDCMYLMSARSLTTLKRNCLLPLQSLVGEDNFTFSISSKEGKLFGRKIILEGANDAQAEAKIRGLTLQGAYCDELTKMQEDFFSMLLSRLSLPGAKLIATTNPDSPSHWLKTNYIDRKDELDFLDVKFLIDDNTTLSREYVDNIKREYVGVFYQRFILGQWTLAEGIVYPMYLDGCIVPTEEREFTRYVISMDYGIQNPTAMLLWGYCEGIWYQVKEYYHSGRETQQQKTDQEYYDELEKLAGDKIIECLIIDPSATSFIALVKQKHRFKIRRAKNDVLDGIQKTASALQLGLIKVNDCCKRTIQEYGSYSWDDSKDDVPIKENDHAMDATRYFVNTMNLTRKKRQYGGDID